MRLQRRQVATREDLQPERCPVGVLCIWHDGSPESWMARYMAPDGAYAVATATYAGSIHNGKPRVFYVMSTEDHGRSRWYHYSRKGNTLIAFEAFARRHRGLDSALRVE